MRQHLFTPCLITLILILSGCATTLSPQQCQQRDWHRQGATDGIAGKPQTYYAHYVSECRAQGITIDGNTPYRQGWQEGNKRYCNPANGYNNGLRGMDYQGVCKGNNEAAYLQAYFQGLNIHTVDSRFAALENKMRRNNNQLTALLAEQNAKYRRLQRDVAKLRKEVETLKKHKPHTRKPKP